MKSPALFPALVLIGSSLTLSAPAVADKFDTGASGSDAFGQLQDMAGSGGSAPTPGAPMGLHQGSAFVAPPPNPRSLPRPAGSRPVAAARAASSARSQESALQAMAAGMIMMSLLNAMDNADANAKAEAEAARARALEEERQRQERLRLAAQQRASWQARDTAMSQVLADALSGGTAFFGQGSAPADAATMNWLATPASAKTVAPPTIPLPTWPAATGPLLEKGAEGLGELAVDMLKGIGKAGISKLVHNADKALDYQDRANAFIGDTFKQLDPGLLAKAAVSSDERYTVEVLKRGDALMRQGQTLAMGEDGPSAEEFEALYRMGSGEKLSAREFGSITWNRMKSWMIDNRLEKMGLKSADD